MVQRFSGVRVAHLRAFSVSSTCYFGYFMFFIECDYRSCLIFILGMYSFDFRPNLDSLDYSCTKMQISIILLNLSSFDLIWWSQITYFLLCRRIASNLNLRRSMSNKELRGVQHDTTTACWTLLIWGKCGHSISFVTLKHRDLHLIMDITSKDTI